MLTYTQIFIGVGSGAVVWHSSHGTSFWPARINLWMHSSMAQILSFAASPRAIKAFGTETVLRRVLDVLVMLEFIELGLFAHARLSVKPAERRSGCWRSCFS